MMRILLLASILALSGCFAPAGPGFDGDGALDYVEGLIMEDDEPRFRVPGTPGHAAAADWLEVTMDMPGWDVTRQTFTGEDFQALDHGAVGSYNQGCPQSQLDHVASLTFHNVYATYNEGDDMVWLGAHWDSKAAGPNHGPVLGANDGASGVGLLIQLMEHISDGDMEFDFGVGIIFFDGEDGFEDCHALAGSLYFARNMPEDLVDAFVLLDMVGDKDARFIRELRSEDGAPELMDLLWKHGHKYAPDAFTDTRLAMLDDHVPFYEEGVPAVDIIDAGRQGTFPPYWHTDGDTLDKLDADMLEAVGNTLWASFEDPDFVASWS